MSIFDTLWGKKNRKMIEDSPLITVLDYISHPKFNEYKFGILILQEKGVQSVDLEPTSDNFSLKKVKEICDAAETLKKTLTIETNHSGDKIYVIGITLFHAYFYTMVNEFGSQKSLQAINVDDTSMLLYISVTAEQLAILNDHAQKSLDYQKQMHLQMASNITRALEENEVVSRPILLAIS